MRLMLDTHALLWFANGDKQLSVSSQSLIESRLNPCLVSVASLWEVVIKQSIGKLSTEIDELFEKMNVVDIQVLPIETQHLTMLRQMPLHHRDPFDRMIIAQALSENLSVITRDTNFKSYGVKTLW